MEKASVKASLLTRHFHNSGQSTMAGSDRTQTTPDLEDLNAARLKTNEEKGQALLGRFIQTEQPKATLTKGSISQQHTQKVVPTMN